MSALNHQETEMLGDVIKFIEDIQREGYDPKAIDVPAEKRGTKEWARMIFLAKQGELLRRRVYTLRAMKGYYPK